MAGRCGPPSNRRLRWRCGPPAAYLLPGKMNLNAIEYRCLIVRFSRNRRERGFRNTTHCADCANLRAVAPLGAGTIIACPGYSGSGSRTTSKPRSIGRLAANRIKLSSGRPRRARRLLVSRAIRTDNLYSLRSLKHSDDGLGVSSSQVIQSGRMRRHNISEGLIGVFAFADTMAAVSSYRSSIHRSTKANS
jgi:hypothetical protein